jgi:hypothetical protein
MSVDTTAETVTDTVTSTTPTTQVESLEVKQEPKTDTESEQKADKAQEAKAESRKRQAADGEEVELDDNERVNLPYSAFQKRLRQAGRAVLREVFGSDDVSKLKKDWDAAQKASAKLSEIEKSRMTAEEKYKREAEDARAQLEELRRDRDERETDMLASQGEQIVVKTAGKFIAEDYIEDAVLIYQGHLTKMDAEELEKLGPDDVESWFKDYAKRRPALAVDKKAASAAPQQRPITNGTPPTKPTDSKAGSTSKTPRPGQPNSMTRAEWEEYKRSHNLDF